MAEVGGGLGRHQSGWRAVEVEERVLYVAWIPGRGPRGQAGVEGARPPTRPLPCPQAWGRERPQRDTASLRAWLELQKMDRNQDGVVTIDEFLETCQKVGSIKAPEPLGPAPASAPSAQASDILLHCFTGAHSLARPGPAALPSVAPIRGDRCGALRTGAHCGKEPAVPPTPVLRLTVLCRGAGPWASTCLRPPGYPGLHLGGWHLSISG